MPHRGSILKVLFILISHTALAQTPSDTVIQADFPKEIIILPLLGKFDKLPDYKGTYNFSGKKSEVIKLDQSPLPLAAKYGRQIFAKVPGLFVYDMDGTGNQVNISTRGLDAHRGWEFNIRKDGVITNSDMYGYPASHYNIPMEAVERIELVRGTGSLQYGAQFGGMINYVNKAPDVNYPFSTEIYTSVGSFGLRSYHVNASGKAGKFRYFFWVNQKESDGYRSNSSSNFDAQNLSLFYDVNQKVKLKLELTRSYYLTKVPGALTDSLFAINPTTSTRSRNYYSPEIFVPSFKLNWKLGHYSDVEFISSAVLGSRNSVLFDRPANVPDTISSVTGDYVNRQVDIDTFNSFTNEFRYLLQFSLWGCQSTTAAGVQYMNNDLNRRQLGRGTAGSDYDLSLVQPGWGRDIHYKTQNIAAYVEQGFNWKEKFSFNLAARYENGKSIFDGSTIYYNEEAFKNTITHQFPLFGVSFQYQLNYGMEFYGGASQAYRPVILKDIIPGSTLEVVDKDLEDAKGYNAELGFRGKRGVLSWDVSGFYLSYQNRLGSLAFTDEVGNLVIYRTNIGDSETKGVEMFFQYKKNIIRKFGVEVFTSSSFMESKYVDATIRNGFQNIDVSGNYVESTPRWMSRNGLKFYGDKWKFGLLYSYVDESFADALNTVTPTRNAAAGLVPSYGLWDINGEWQIIPEISISANISNVLDKSYFTKRPQLYPGPGVWPSDGRSFLLTLKFSLNTKTFKKS